jgi:PKD repeat protein
MRSKSVRRAVASVVETLELRRMFSAYINEAEYSDPAGLPFGTFGRGMATSGTLALIASPGVPGVNDSAATTGHVSLIDTTTGDVVRIFENPDAEEGDFFGNAVAFVGGKIAISAPENTGGGVGKVYVYDNAADETPLIIESPYPTVFSSPVFGATLAAYGDDLLVGVIQTSNANENGAIIRYDIDPTNGTADPIFMFDPNSSTNDQFGSALASDGASIWATAQEDTGSVVIEMDGNGNYIRTISQPADAFGAAIAVDGSRLVIGAPGSNTVYQLDKGTADVQQVYTGGALDFGFGSAVAISGDILVVGSPNALTALDEFSGYNSGRAEVFNMSTATSEAVIENPAPQQIVPDEGNMDAFGTAVAALPGGKVLVADPYDDNGGTDVGRVWLFSGNTSPSDASIAGASAAVRNQTINFTGSFTDPDEGDAHTISWDFGDGNTLADGGLNVSHAYAATGSYTVTMTVTDSANASTTAQFIVNITATATSQDGQTLYVGGTNGNDSIVLKKNSSGASSVTMNGTTATIAGGRIVVLAGDGNDSIDASSNINSALEVYGGAGNDTIKGGGTGDLLIGGDGSDIITGGQGRDILIGGTGADQLFGNQADDVLIAGSTVHDNDSAALASIRATWNSNQSYAARVNALRSNQLRPDVDVFDDGAIDALTGGGGTDWFVFNVDAVAKDVIIDLKKDETATDVD